MHEKSKICALGYSQTKLDDKHNAKFEFIAALEYIAKLTLKHAKLLVCLFTTRVGHMVRITFQFIILIIIAAFPSSKYNLHE